MVVLRLSAGCLFDDRLDLDFAGVEEIQDDMEALALGQRA
jgi:hypothetical protein